ncbi:FtsK/SpoIIIE domain-containing protein [Streptomyces roseifaciens]
MAEDMGDVVPFRTPHTPDPAEAPASLIKAAPQPVEPTSVVPGKPYGVPALPPDLAGDTPLTPQWARTRKGWRARAGIVRRSRARAARRWVRRQRTEHGHAAQIQRGERRVRAWVAGVDGIQVQAAKHAAHAASRQAARAARRARWARLPLAGKAEQAQVDAERAMTASTAAHRAYLTARKNARRGRMIRGSAVYGPAAAGLGAAYAEGGGVGLALAALGLCAGCALLGRRLDVEESWDAERTTLGDGDPMTEVMLNRAFREVGLIRGDQSLRLILPSGLDRAGRNWTATLDLPGGLVYDAVKAKEVQLAGALGINRCQLDITKMGREDRISLWAAPSDPFLKARCSPLVGTADRINTWRDGIPMAFTKRGEIIFATVSDYSYLLAGTTRSGKGMGVANILAGAMLDPRVNIRLFDGKGTGEYVGIAPALATYVRRNPARLLEFLRVLAAEMERRADILTDLGLSKASEALLDKLGGIELVIVDELATYTAKKGLSAEYAEEITELLAQIAAVGAALGIVLVLATQVPESDIVPTRLRANCAARWAMRTESADSSNVILGKGKAGDGYDASKIGIEVHNRGRGWLTTPDTGFVEVRSLFIDEKKGELLAIMSAALPIRAEFGSLPGSFHDPVEAELIAITGASSVAGGPDGKGAAVRARPLTVLDHMRQAAEATGRGNITRAEIFEHLATVDPQYRQADSEDDGTYAARAGRMLAAGLKELGADVAESRLRLPDGSRPNGWTLDAIEGALNVPV